MNEFKGVVSKINSLDSLNIIEFYFYDTILYMMGLDLDYIKVGNEVILTIKASNISIAKDLKGQISLSNSIKSKIIKLNMGKLLTSLSLQHKETIFTSTITTKSTKKMNLKIGDDISAMFKSSELSIKKVL